MNATPSKRQSSDGDDRPAILIFGASVRAAAQSALRAGMKPIAADLFGDVDLCESAEVLPLGEYPTSFVQIAERVPSCPWMYTGGLENYPEVVAGVSRGRSLWGNDANVLRSICDPQQTCEFLRQQGLPAATVRPTDDPPPMDGEWLLKPTGGAGGSGIVVWDDAATDHPTLQRPHYFQQRLVGTPISAVFLGNRNKVHLIGTTRQFVGTKMLGAGPFAYCGSLGPYRFSSAVLESIVEVGRSLGLRLELRGLFGVDFICNGSSVRPVEVNPRYVASTEVLELALGIPLLDWHRRSCETFDETENTEFDVEVAAALRGVDEQQRNSVGKAILFASNDLVWPPANQIRAALHDEGTQLADIPQPGTRIECGRPVCTVIAAGKSKLGCLRQLASAIRRVKQFIAAGGCS